MRRRGRSKEGERRREARNSGGAVRHKSKQVVTELTPVCWGQAGRQELVDTEEDLVTKC